MIQSHTKQHLLNEIEEMRYRLTKIVSEYDSFIHHKVIEQSQILDNKLNLWQKMNHSN
ncbi:MAG: Spo0E like sporulation regulatory protein [Bacillota bacterium]|jgi:hypothetical protein